MLRDYIYWLSRDSQIPVFMLNLIILCVIVMVGILVYDCVKPTVQPDNVNLEDGGKME